MTPFDGIKATTKLLYGHVHLSINILRTFAVEHSWRSCQDEFVPHGSGVSTLCDSWFHVIILDPLGEPGQRAVAIQGVSSQRAKNKYNHQQSLSSSIVD